MSGCFSPKADANARALQSPLRWMSGLGLQEQRTREHEGSLRETANPDGPRRQCLLSPRKRTSVRTARRSGNDAVDGAHSAASECHRVVALERTTLRGAVHGRGYHDWSRYCEVGIPGTRG